MICYLCKTAVSLHGRPQRNETCPKCSAYLHCCYNCTFYARTAHNQCLETQAEWIKDKEMGNYCDYFVFGEGKGEVDTDRKDDALKKLNDLFKK